MHWRWLMIGFILGTIIAFGVHEGTAQQIGILSSIPGGEDLAALQLTTGFLSMRIDRLIERINDLSTLIDRLDGRLDDLSKTMARTREEIAEMRGRQSITTGAAVGTPTTLAGLLVWWMRRNKKKE